MKEMCNKITGMEDGSHQIPRTASALEFICSKKQMPSRTDLILYSVLNIKQQIYWILLTYLMPTLNIKKGLPIFLALKNADQVIVYSRFVYNMNLDNLKLFIIPI